MDTLGVIATVIVVIATAVATQIGESIRQWLIENVVDPFGQFLIEKLVKPVGQWLGYSFHYSSNIDNMKEQAEKLGEHRERVKHSVEAGIGNCGENKADVNRWLENVDVIMGKVRKVLEDEAKAKIKCSYEICLKLKLRHELSKKAKKIEKDIDEVLENGGFDQVSNMDYMNFNSRMLILKDLMVALGDVNISMIGVWGMPGAGKTTLVREVVWQAKKEKLFDEVAMATVMQSPDLRQIQGEIADMLDLKFDDVETVPGRAIRLRDRLKRNNKALVILDDIWNKLDLEAIGIPCNRCKILLTSRDRDILSCEMNTQKKFELDVLSPDEAWSLFEKMAGDSPKDPNLRSIATQVAQVCAGLPLALVTVATALKNKSSFEWEDALQQLRRPSPVHLTGMQAAIYSKIELSYKHLGSPVVKSFFLLCSQMGPAILYLDLVKYCFGLCLFPGIRTLEEARNKVYTLVRSLKDSCLLLEDPRSSKYVRMHDLVRDVAMLIAKAQNVFTVRNDDPVKWPDEDALTTCSSISVRAEDIHELPDRLVCPKLKFLYMHGRDWDFKISKTFFRGMRELKVLDLTKMRLSSLPSSINLLTNLQTLCLDQCVLKHIAVIGELKNLEILSLLSSKFTQLPKEIGLLTRLRLMDLSNCTKLEVIPPNVLSCLVQLEELYVCNSFTQWELEGLNNERASLAELKHLSLLTTLEVNIPNANMLPKNLLFKMLKRYQIFIGDVWDQFGKSESSRALKLKLNSSFELEQGIKMLLSGIEDLSLDELKGVKSIISELDSKGFQQLKHLHVQNNSEMKYIYSKGLAIAEVVFPVLEIFSLKNMINLEEICHGQIPLRSFGNLSIVKVEHCEKLKFIFSSSIAKGLSQLQTLEIRECSIMGAIVEKEEGRIEDTDMKLFPKLHRLLLHRLPKLMSFSSTQNSDIIDAGEVIPESEQVVFPNLETLDLSSIHSEEILLHNHHRATSSFKLTDPRFHNLCNLIVKGSGNLKYLLSSSTVRFMVQLKYLYIEDCKVMEEILLTEDLGEEEIIPKVLFPQLKDLFLKDLPVLKRFCIGSNIRFPSLTGMTIEQCPKLESFIFKPVSSEEISRTAMQPLFNEKVAFPSLKTLCLLQCMLEDIAMIGELRNLEILILRLPSVEQLPRETGLLTLLRILNLNNCTKLKVIPPNVLSCLIQLEELYVGNSFTQWDVEGLNNERASLAGLKHLSRLTTLVVYIPDANMLPKYLLFEKLQKYKIFVGDVWDWSDKHENSRALKLKLNTSFHLERGIKMLLNGIENLWLDELKGVKSIIYELDMTGFQQLKHLHVQNNVEIKYIINSRGMVISDGVFPVLEMLSLKNMINLEEICHGQIPSASFRNLSIMKVEHCEKLKFIFLSTIAKGLPQLQKLVIQECSIMGAIIIKEEGEIEDTDRILFPQLRHLELHQLPKLVSFLIRQKSVINDPGEIIPECKLDFHMPILQEQVVFPNLETLELSSIHSEEMLLHNQHRATSSFKLTDPRFHNLCNLTVKGSGNLKYLLSSSTATFMVQLKDLYIKDCKVMEEVLHIEEEETLSDALFPRLECVVLEDLPVLKRFCIDSNVEFPLFKKFSVKNCPKLKTFAFRHASSNMEDRKGFVEINSEDNRHTTSQSHINESIVFANLESLEQSLIDLEEKQQNQHWASSFCKITNMQTSISFQNLSYLGVWGSDSFKYLLSSAIARSMVQVKCLRIANCKAMEEILFIEDLGEEEEEEIIPKMLFPRLEDLELNGLPILKRFCIGRNIEFPSMKRMWIEHCPKLKTFISKPSNSDTVMTVCKEIKKMNTEEIPRTVAIQPLFSEEVAFPSLEYLEISYVDDLKIIWDNQIPPYSFCKLQAMKVEFCENLTNIFQSDMLTRFRSLENLTITDCGSLQEVFQLQEQDAKETHDVIVIPLKELRLDRVPKLKYVWNKDPQGIFNFPNLNLESTGLRSYWSDSVPSD